MLPDVAQNGGERNRQENESIRYVTRPNRQQHSRVPHRCLTRSHPEPPSDSNIWGLIIFILLLFLFDAVLLMSLRNMDIDTTPTP
jgi:hypothetical protein